MKIKEIITHLEQLFPVSYQEEYDNSGLQVGDPLQEATGALLTLDLTEEVLQEAVSRGCNLVISHHPLIFRGIKSLSGDHPVQRMIVGAVREGLVIYSIHTNLDNSLNGLNAFLGRKLGLSGISLLRPASGQLAKLVTFCPVKYEDKVRNALFEAGAGHIGNYDACSFNVAGKGTFRASAQANPFVGEKNVLHEEPETRIEVIFPAFLADRLVKALKEHHPYEEVAYDIYPLLNENPVAGSGILGKLENAMDENTFLETVKTLLGISCLRHSALSGRMVSHVALCTGSGAFLIPDAIRQGAEAFLTADLKYHDFMEGSGRLLLTDIGHFESERYSVELLDAVLKEKFPTFASLISGSLINPVKYL
ncbi:MAG TPA: Nif3-like dinuclear metal center hexameric protein [Bacteroidales bacterium]|nr:Nif3-like dinuclear metal center hexameric protein [Bacteroidales bacterium]